MNLVVWAELVVGNEVGDVGVQKGTKCHTIVPTAAEVGDVDVLWREL